MTRAFAALTFWIAAGTAAYGQQQYGDPTTFPGTYLTQRSSPPLPVNAVPRIDVTYFVSGTFSLAQHALINQAAAVWSSTIASVNLVEVGTAGAASIDLLSVNIGNGNNLATRVIPTSPGAGTYPDGTPWRQINNALITIDSNPSAAYFVGAGPVPAGQFDFFSLALRELGFGLGLGFATSDPNSVMDSNLQVGEQHRTLSAADVAALTTLYGMPEPSTWALLAVGMAALLLGRKFIF